MRSVTRRGARTLAAVALCAVAGRALPAQIATPAAQPASAAARPLSLDEALRIAEDRSEGVRIARAGVLRARGQQYQARAQYLPQLNGSVSFQKTLQSQFEAISRQAASLSGPAGPATYGVCTTQPIPDTASATTRQNALNTARTSCGGGATDLANSPLAKIFAAKQTLTLGLQGSWTVFAGGRLLAANRIAGAARRSAEIGLASATASLRLQVTEAYYDAALAEQLSSIADSSLAQSERTLAQVTLARNVGNTSEFELLRAQVTRDNQRPAVIQSRTRRDLAMLRLKQLLDFPADQPLTLVSAFADSTMHAAALDDSSFVAAARAAIASDTSAEGRAQVRQLAQAVQVQENQFRIARAQRIPALTLSTQYGRIGYPTGGSVPGWDAFYPNWTVTAMLSVPLFTGGRITGDEMVARANLMEARENYQQTKELAALDTRSAIADLEQAIAAWNASAGTAEQASRAYGIAEVRYREGISTQLELSESRLLLEQSAANRASAARNLRVAEVRLALIHDLPLGTVTQGAAGAAAGATQQQSTPQQTTPQPQNAAGATNTNSFGGQQ
ncbi:MAG: TolC family protein [Gemmatimonadaceae bacterium]|nr:TolC family protein [Gemmatimonadaceae bacterium]NUQ93613.1 TolC family protein [Gemmatimonadaceae bacterium]NUR20780.1 TolC family protein [Gemmatimonadaceae bacterium]